MIGIEHEKATLEQREVFSFHMHTAKEAMRQIVDEYEIDGCIIISTCNRTELYISTEETIQEIWKILCDVKGMDIAEYEEKKEVLFTERKEEETIRHLLLLACGMKSKIFGEDQIITQVKDALAWAREIETTDIVLEKLFQTAITAAKKVKTQVHLTAVQTSVIENMMHVLKRHIPSLNGIPCLVIGNGEIGKLAVQRLLDMNADVTMTLRQYKTKEVEIPEACHVIDYHSRYEHLWKYDIIISGTSSPHHTIKFEEASECLKDGKQRIMIDLAVPRDISSRLECFTNIKLYNVDRLGGVAKDEVNNVAVAKAMEIIDEYEKEFITWNVFRNYIPLIQAVGHYAGLNTFKRIEKKLKNFVEPNNQEAIEKLIRHATEKMVTSMLYGLKENLSKEYWQECLSAIETVMIKNED